MTSFNSHFSGFENDILRFFSETLLGFKLDLILSKAFLFFNKNIDNKKIKLKNHTHFDLNSFPMK